MSGPETGKSNTLLAVDTGGTFTDLLVFREGRIHALKVPSTPRDPSEGVLTGLRQLIPESEDFALIHGSTVATNTLLERKGATVALITNRGFEDVIEIGRQNRPQLYALVGHRLPPLVPRGLRVGVAGRLDSRGEVLEPLNATELEALPRRLAGAESLAIVLLHSYANPAHEQTIAEVLREMGLPLAVSSELIPEYREYERTSTTVVNAYVAPVMSSYLGRLAREAKAEPIRVMASNGGVLPVARAVAQPVHTILSGPAGGVVGALAWGRKVGFDDIITFDMGGTSTDVSLCPGRPLHTLEFEIGGQPVALPVIDIHTVGAGGGSLARLDPGGALRVGPQSAGADPGPICYGRGGRQLTVTDANVWLGRLPADAFLGGEGRLVPDEVESEMKRLASAMSTSQEAAAEGILAVVNSAMERALRVISVERGHDPADFSLVAFGGAGGLHVAELAARLGTPRALIPPGPGLLSAFGMLVAPISQDLSRTVLVSDQDAEHEALLEEVFGSLEAEALSRMADDGFPAESVSLERRVDARYRGQSFELRVPAEGWQDRFHGLHRERYGYARLDTAVEAVTLRVAARTHGLEVPSPRLEPATGPPPTEPAEVLTDGRRQKAVRVWRRDLRSGHSLQGPSLVLEYSSTTWIPEGWQLQVDGWGCLHLSPSA
jgi:N-methylhydantoinase A